jgi:hypothetical protein
MNLNEYANAISENARKISVDNGPLVETMNLMVDTMEKMIAGQSDPRLREGLGELLGEFKIQRDQMVHEFPRDMEEVKQSIIRSADETAGHLRQAQVIHDQGMEELRQLEEELAHRQQQPEEEISTTPATEPAADPVPDFTDGDILLQSLLRLNDPVRPASQTPRVSGNIWDDWK